MQLWQGLSVTILFIINRLRESYGSLFLFQRRKRLHKLKAKWYIKKHENVNKGVFMKRNTQANDEKSSSL